MKSSDQTIDSSFSFESKKECETDFIETRRKMRAVKKINLSEKNIDKAMI